MKTRRQALGQWGEEVAARYLSEKGYSILAYNARTPFGEIDLVAMQAETCVFVEVKTRSTSGYGLPEEAVTRQKKAHLLASAQAYLLAHPELGGDWRVDVIAIRRLRSDQQPEILHIENAIQEC